MQLQRTALAQIQQADPADGQVPCGRSSLEVSHLHVHFSAHHNANLPGHPALGRAALLGALQAAVRAMEEAAAFERIERKDDK